MWVQEPKILDYYFPGTLVGTCIKYGAVRTPGSTHMICHCCRWQTSLQSLDITSKYLGFLHWKLNILISLSKNVISVYHCHKYFNKWNKSQKDKYCISLRCKNLQKWNLLRQKVECNFQGFLLGEMERFGLKYMGSSHDGCVRDMYQMVTVSNSVWNLKIRINHKCYHLKWF